VQREALDRFLELLEPAVTAFRVGSPLDEGTQMGPLVSGAHSERVAGFLDGARVAFRGEAPSGPGFWFPPTVLLPDSEDDPLLREE
ncbi:aldehyde dehydrogenase family protein, partial [Staphylococcus aureus]|nr:aldehyde dehydrogenase family protein [Staphylococcus aureus]